MLENKINKHCQLFSYSEIFSQKWEVTPQKSYMRYIWIHSCCKNNLKYKKSRSPILIVIMWCNVMCSVQLSSVAQSCPTLCDCMNRSTPGLPSHHQLPEFTQTHVHQVGDAIQPSHPLSSPFPPAPNPSRIRVFSNESTLCMRWPKYWSFSFTIIPFKNTQELSPLEWTRWIALESKELSRVFSNTTVQKHQFFGAQLSSWSNSHIHIWPLEKPYPWLDGP